MTTTESPALPHNASRFIPVQTRSERPHSFEPSDFRAPTGREVDWRYSPVARFAPLFVDEPGTGSVTVTVSAPEGAETGSLAPGESPRGTAFVPEDLPAAIASAQVTQATFVDIVPDAELDEPIRISLTGTGIGQRDLVHLVVRAGARSSARVVLEHTGAATLSENVEIVLDEGANVEFITIHEWDDTTVHTGAHQARLANDATLTHTIITFGGSVVRVNPTVHLDGRGAEGIMRGLYFADAGQHFEHQVYVEHVGERTVSDVNYKGALQGKGARTVWIGDVLIRPTATGTNSYEQNRNLILSDGARADSVPNLEIETGDIEGAGHASATGRFELDQLFYLMARGIDENTARRLVVHGFLNEIVQSIGDPEIQERMRDKLEQELNDSTETLMAADAV